MPEKPQGGIIARSMNPKRRLRPAACLALFLALGPPALALELDLGLGIKIDIAPYGIENATLLALAAPWIGSREGLQAGLLLGGSVGPCKADLELSACLRAWPFHDAFAVFGGAGLVAEVYRSVPGLVPALLGGLLFGQDSLGFAACAELRLKSGDTDAMLWVAAERRYSKRDESELQ